MFFLPRIWDLFLLVCACLLVVYHGKQPLNQHLGVGEHVFNMFQASLSNPSNHGSVENGGLFETVTTLRGSPFS